VIWLLRAVGCGLPLLLALLVAACTPPPPPPLAGAPAQRIVSLAPHLTEMAYAVGAGGRLVGVVEFSDYPPPARDLPRVGDAFRVDYEALAALAPDLVLAWRTGNPPALIDQLRMLGYRVVEFEPASLETVANQLLELGALAGTADTAERAAAAFRAAVAALRAKYRGAAPVTVFYQVAREPLFTISKRHVIGQIIELCGGRNVFGELAGLTPVVNLEAVLEAEPEVILVGGQPGDHPAVLEDWRQWPTLPAVQAGSLFVVDADLLSRPGPRVVEGAAQVCAMLDQAREARASQP
jgi:iron complex transport system substrate-binding protein